MTTTLTDTAAPAVRLSRWTKFIYGLGEFGPSVAGGTIIPFYFLFFLTDVAGVRPGVAGSILLVARLWDAVNDPLIGVLSDRTRTRLGRRRPFILAGALPLAATYILLWIVPTGLTGNALALYYLGAYFLYDLFMTLTAGPFYALMPELSLDSDERTSIVTYRMATSIITGLLAAVALPLVFNVAPSMRVGFGWAAVGVGICSALPYLLIVAFVRERPDFQAPPRISIPEFDPECVAVPAVLAGHARQLARLAGDRHRRGGLRLLRRVLVRDTRGGLRDHPGRDPWKRHTLPAPREPPRRPGSRRSGRLSPQQEPGPQPTSCCGSYRRPPSSPCMWSGSWQDSASLPPTSCPPRWRQTSWRPWKSIQASGRKACLAA